MLDIFWRRFTVACGPEMVNLRSFGLIKFLDRSRVEILNPVSIIEASSGRIVADTFLHPNQQN